MAEVVLGQVAEVWSNIGVIRKFIGPADRLIMDRNLEILQLRMGKNMRLQRDVFA